MKHWTESCVFARKFKALMSRITLLFISFLLFAACRDKTPSPSNTPAQPDQTTQIQGDRLPADFNEFYEKFHSDSLYQVAHISWPLQGLTTVQVDTSRQEKQAIYWEKADWRMHRPVNFSSGEFQRKLQVLGDELVVEHISYAAANFGLERRFVRSSQGEWELIYYADMQETGQ